MLRVSKWGQSPSKFNWKQECCCRQDVTILKFVSPAVYEKLSVRIRIRIDLFQRKIKVLHYCGVTS